MPKATINGEDEDLLAIRGLYSLAKASSKWHWRSLAIIVAIASVISAIFQVLNFFD